MTHTQSITVREATFALLRAHGMTTVFGNPGSTELKFFRDWPDDFRYVLGLQESCVVAMADGFAQSTGRAAFVNLHSAAGVGHALGSIYTAYRNHTPLVITAGQQTRAMFPTEPFLFAQDAAEFPRPYVKWSVEPARAEDVPVAIERAWHIAMQPPRGPVFVSVPEDDWDVPTAMPPVRHVTTSQVATDDALDGLARTLGASKRPCIVVGASVDQDGAWDSTVRLAERLGAVVWASPMAGRCGFPEDHPLFGGHLPPLRQPLADRLAGHDVILVLGAPVFTYHVHTGGDFIPAGARLFLMTDDPAEAARAAVGDAIVGGLKGGIDAVVARLGQGVPAPQRGRVPVAPPDAAGGLSGEFVMATIARLRPKDSIVVEEAPTHRNALWDLLPVHRPGTFFAGAAGALGWAIAASVGVSMGSPARKVVCIVGDGSALFGIQALWTAAQWKLPVTFVVFNNRGYSALKSFGRMLGIPGAPGHDVDGVDFVDVARGLGCAATRVTAPGELVDTLQAEFAASRTTVVDVVLAPEAVQLY